MTYGVDVEAEAAWLLSRARYTTHDVPGPLAVAEGLGLRVRAAPRSALRSATGMMCMLHGQWMIFVRRGLAATQLAFVLAHEIAEWHCKVNLRYAGADKEDVCDAIAGAIVAPREAFHEAVQEHGEGALKQLAFDFATTQTCAALRVGEVERLPVRVIAPHAVRTRGEDFAWPALDASRARQPGIRRIRITDGRRRFAQLAAS